MKQLLARVATSQPLTARLQLHTLTSSELPQLRAGQLVLARAAASLEPYLRQPLFAMPSLTANDSCSVITQQQAKLGETLDLIAPVGNGFALDASTRRLLLVGDGTQPEPLIALTREATRKQVAVTLLVAGAARDDETVRFYESLLPLDVEYQFVSDIAADALRWCDQLCAAGSTALYTQIKNALAQMAMQTPRNFAQVIVAPPMACGCGACLACAVETHRGMRLACVDGPVFDLMEMT